MTDHLSFFDYDPEIGRTVYLIFDEKGNLKGAKVYQEADKIIEANAQTRAFNAGRKWGDYKPAASMPLTLYEQLGMQDAVNARDRKYISKVLNDPDFSKFRTSEGKV